MLCKNNWQIELLMLNRNIFLFKPTNDMILNGIINVKYEYLKPFNCLLTNDFLQLIKKVAKYLFT